MFKSCVYELFVIVMFPQWHRQTVFSSIIAVLVIADLASPRVYVQVQLLWVCITAAAED